MDARRGSIAWLVLAALLVAFAAKGWLLQPAAPPAAVTAGAFDTQRALGRLARILGDQRPHTVDSADGDAVRNRLIAELRALGLEPRVQDQVDCSALPKSRFVGCARVRNVIATLGSGSGKHVLLNAHYDSTPAGPGAGDDGLGVALLLEVAAQLRERPLDRPVTLLFNEGEEFGLNGASAFVRFDPDARKVGSLINIEARGVSGPALMFETSDPNGPAIAAFAASSDRPYANSLSMDFARLIPNTTDVVEFRPARWTILNYAIIGNEARYHTPGDTIAALDRASLHHAGSQVLAATRVLGAAHPPSASGRMVFTDIAGRLFLRLPLAVAAVGLALLVALAGVTAWRRRALGRPLATMVAMTLAGIAAAALAATIAGLVRPGDYWRATPLVAYLAVYATLLLAMVAVWSGLGRKVEARQARAAAWLFILLLGGLASIGLPGASIYFLVAPGIALAGLMLERRMRHASALLVVAALVNLLMCAQMLAFIEVLLVDGPLYAVAPLAAIAALPLLVELRPALFRPLIAALAVAAICLWAAALLLPRASAERPAAFTIDYFRDDSTGKNLWAASTKQAPLPNGFPGRWRTAIPDYGTRTRWVAPAPLLDTPRLAVGSAGATPDGKGRRVRLTLATGGANAVSIYLAKGTPVRRLGIVGDTLPIPDGKQRALLRCSGRSCDGMVVEMWLTDRKPVVADLYATRFALPPEGAALVERRPADAHPQYGTDSSIRKVRIRF